MSGIKLFKVRHIGIVEYVGEINIGRRWGCSWVGRPDIKRSGGCPRTLLLHTHHLPHAY